MYIPRMTLDVKADKGKTRKRTSSFKKRQLGVSAKDREGDTMRDRHLCAREPVMVYDPFTATL